MSKEEKLIRQMHQMQPIAGNMIIPNHSGDLSAGMVRTTPTDNLDVPNKAYVDSSIAAAGHARQHAINSAAETQQG